MINLLILNRHKKKISPFFFSFLIYFLQPPSNSSKFFMDFEMENKIEFSELFTSYEIDYKTNISNCVDFLKRVKDHKINGKIIAAFYNLVGIATKEMEKITNEIQTAESCVHFKHTYIYINNILAETNGNRDKFLPRLNKKRF